MASQVVQPSNHVSFKQFKNLFNKNGSFNSTKYAACKLEIDLVKRFTTADTQKIVFDRFFMSVGKFSMYKEFSSINIGEYAQYMTELKQRYIKLRNLIENNSVLLQHFGTPIQFAVPSKCVLFKSGDHKVCMTHAGSLIEKPPAYKRKLDEIEAVIPDYHSYDYSEVPTKISCSKIKISDGDDLVNCPRVNEEDYKSGDEEIPILGNILLGLRFFNRY